MILAILFGAKPCAWCDLSCLYHLMGQSKKKPKIFWRVIIQCPLPNGILQNYSFGTPSANGPKYSHLNLILAIF